MGIEFRTCPKCNGYGVLDDGRNCRMCIGSGEIMIDSDTGRRITVKQLSDRVSELARQEGMLPQSDG